MLFYLLLFACAPKGTLEDPQVPSMYESTAEIPLSQDVRMGTLDNGLTYYIRSNGEPEQRVELQVVVKVGSLFEEDDQLGLAHFLEHMAFNGTESFPKNSLVDYMESIGMGFGAHVNALTGFDRTVYKLHVPTENEENIEQALMILKEQVGNQLLLDEDIDLDWRAKGL